MLSLGPSQLGRLQVQACHTGSFSLASPASSLGALTLGRVMAAPGYPSKTTAEERRHFQW